jgi:hypothetical protein
MRRVSRLCFAILILTLAGCVDIDIRTKINRDGGGVQRWGFTTSALIGDKIKKEILNDPYFQKLPGKIQEEYKEGDYILTWQAPFQNVSELERGWHAVHFEKRGVFRNVYSYSEVWELKSGTRLDEINKKWGALVPLTVKTTIELPGRIVDSNADLVQDNAATWNIRLNDLTPARTLRLQTVEWNLRLLIPLVVIVGLGLIGVLVAVLLSMKKSPSRAITAVTSVCSNCNRPVPPGSAFCNGCGAKLQ